MIVTYMDTVTHKGNLHARDVYLRDVNDEFLDFLFKGDN